MYMQNPKRSPSRVHGERSERLHSMADRIHQHGSAEPSASLSSSPPPIPPPHPPRLPPPSVTMSIPIRRAQQRIQSNRHGHTDRAVTPPISPTPLIKSLRRFGKVEDKYERFRQARRSNDALVLPVHSPRSASTSPRPSMRNSMPHSPRLVIKRAGRRSDRARTDDKDVVVIEKIHSSPSSSSSPPWWQRLQANAKRGMSWRERHGIILESDSVHRISQSPLTPPSSPSLSNGFPSSGCPVPALNVSKIIDDRTSGVSSPLPSQPIKAQSARQWSQQATQDERDRRYHCRPRSRVDVDPQLALTSRDSPRHSPRKVSDARPMRHNNTRPRSSTGGTVGKQNSARATRMSPWVSCSKTMSPVVVNSSESIYPLQNSVQHLSPSWQHPSVVRWRRIRPYSTGRTRGAGGDQRHPHCIKAPRGSHGSIGTTRGAHGTEENRGTGNSRDSTSVAVHPVIQSDADSSAEVSQSDLIVRNVRRGFTDRISREHGFLSELDIDKLLKDTGYNRRELYVIFARFKALCALSPLPGGIDKETFQRGVARLAVEDDMFVDRVFKLLDEDGSGQIEWGEFIMAMAALERGDAEIKNRFCFQTYDLDEDGFIGRSDLSRMFSSSSMLMQDETTTQVVNTFVDRVFRVLGVQDTEKITLENVSDYMANSAQPGEDVWDLFGRSMLKDFRDVPDLLDEEKEDP